MDQLFRFVTRPTGWPTKVLIRTDLGAASLIARQAPIVLSPNGHDSLLAQFLLESVTVGVFGGLLGSSAGIIAVVVVSAVNGGTPVLDLSLAAAPR
ncbi:hypothetical protein [Amycolatopsis sp. NPDC001319]|uniref:hypothetical protein n=1 Tax=unclassified Amycolatopsis TaxID=2618356 RepID=UPI0036811F13